MLFRSTILFGLLNGYCLWSQRLIVYLSLIHISPNRYPIQTEVHTFNEEVITDAINFEMSRNGQVFFVNNRIANLLELKAMIERHIPDCRVAIEMCIRDRYTTGFPVCKER